MTLAIVADRWPAPRSGKHAYLLIMVDHDPKSLVNAWASALPGSLAQMAYRRALL